MEPIMTACCHAATTLGNELVTTWNSRQMLGGGFRVIWDTLYINMSQNQNH